MKQERPGQPTLVTAISLSLVAISILSIIWMVRGILGWFGFGILVDLLIGTCLFVTAVLLLVGHLWFMVLGYLDREFVRRRQADDNTDEHPASH